MQIIQSIQNRIYEIRGQRVLIDKDLAILYETDVRSLNQAVKRNIKRFPEDFMFQLTAEEWESIRSQVEAAAKSGDSLKSQIVISNPSGRGGARTLPYAFTEHGVLMLASVLRSKIAMQVSVRIIETFVKMREMLSVHSEILLKLERLETQTWRNTEDIQKVFDYLKQLLIPAEQVNRRRIGFRQDDGAGAPQL